MKEFITQDGNRIYKPDSEPAVAAEPEIHAANWPGYHCDCHRRMGNDFWFLPTGQCLRDDRTCNAKVPL